jgi:hypothetical protein
MQRGDGLRRGFACRVREPDHPRRSTVDRNQHGRASAVRQLVATVHERTHVDALVRHKLAIAHQDPSSVDHARSALARHRLELREAATTVRDGLRPRCGKSHDSPAERVLRGHLNGPDHCQELVLGEPVGDQDVGDFRLPC